MSAPKPDLCSYAHARAKLDVSERQLHKMIAAGALKRVHIRLPGAKRPLCRLTVDSVDALARGDVKAAPAAPPPAQHHDRPAKPERLRRRPPPGLASRRPTPLFV